MPIKKETTTVKPAKASKIAEPKVAAATTTARTATKTPRVTSSKHSKVSASAPVAASVAAAETIIVNPEEFIATLAYGYWESRGFQGGSELEDWFRAEAEYRKRYVAA